MASLQSVQGLPFRGSGWWIRQRSARKGGWLTEQRLHQRGNLSSCQKSPLLLLPKAGRCNVLPSEGDTHFVIQAEAVRPDDKSLCNGRRAGWHMRNTSNLPAKQHRSQWRTSAAAKTVPEQHLAQVVAEETTVSAFCRQ